MIRVTLMDGSLQEVRREEVFGLYPATALLRHPLLKSEAIFCHKGKLIPIAGPLPETLDLTLPVNERPWLMLFAGHAQVIYGLPEFDDDISHSKTAPTLVKASTPTLELVENTDEEEARLLEEMEELLKSA